MPIIDIHGKKVHVEDEHHESLGHAIKWLGEHKSDAENAFEAAHHNHTTGLAHFDTNKPAGYHGTDKFSLLHNSDGTYTLRKKEHHIF